MVVSRRVGEPEFFVRFSDPNALLGLVRGELHSAVAQRRIRYFRGEGTTRSSSRRRT
jgi:hypothetical protein